MVRTGAYFYGGVKTESSFKNKASSPMTKVFGLEQRFTPLRINNNRLEVQAQNSVILAKHAFGQFEGAYSVESDFSTPWMLEYALGLFPAPSGGGGNPYVFTQPTPLKAKPSFTSEFDFAAVTENSVRTPYGCVLANYVLSSAIGQKTKQRCDVVYAQEDNPTTSLNGVPADDTNTIYTNASSQLQISTSTSNSSLVDVSSELQSWELTISPKPTLQGGHNTPNPQAVFWGKTDIQLRYNVAKNDRQRVLDALARAELASAQLLITNGLAGLNVKSILFTLTGLAIDDHTENYTPNDPVYQEMPLVSRDISAVVTTNISTVP